MSSVCSCGSASSSVLMQQVQQQLQGTDPRQAATDSTSPNATRQNPLVAAAVAAGIDPSVLTGLRGEIESAIQDAVQNSDGSTNRRDAIKSAIDGVLESHGIDAASLRTQLDSLLKAHGGAHRRHGAHAAKSGSARPATTTQENSLSTFLGTPDDGDGDSDSLSIASSLQGLPAGSLVNVDG